ncbi:MAG: DUF2188 domain-containing protein [Methylorubrum populi]
MSKNDLHVVPRGGKWKVRKAGATRASAVFDTQHEAIVRASEIARSQQAELYIHGQDGRIRQKTSFGNDPYPPKG